MIGWEYGFAKPESSLVFSLGGQAHKPPGLRRGP
jgi:hypothetical protein